MKRPKQCYLKLHADPPLAAAVITMKDCLQATWPCGCIEKIGFKGKRELLQSCIKRRSPKKKHPTK